MYLNNGLWKEFSNCGECPQYPCDIVKEWFEVTSGFEPQCKEYCNSSQYKILKEAFFDKKKNLDLIYTKNKRVVKWKNFNLKLSNENSNL